MLSNFRVNRGHTLSVPSLVIFRLGEQRYGLPLACVERIVRMVEVSPLPKAPKIVLGVIDVAGRIVPVFDIRQRFGLPPREPNPLDQLILARTALGSAALIVDETSGVLESEAESTTAPHEVMPKLEFVSGILRRDDGLIFIHDLDAFLSGEEAAALDLALAATEPA